MCLSKLLVVVSAGLFLLTGCRSDQCDDVANAAPYVRHAYLNKQVFIYPTTELFEFSQPVLLDSAEKKLAPVIAFAHKHPELMISIASYATNASNSRVSTEQRDFQAEAVAARLWASGVKSSIRYKGFEGGEHSVSSNRIAQIGAENRRIEIEFS